MGIEILEQSKRLWEITRELERIPEGADAYTVSYDDGTQSVAFVIDNEIHAVQNFRNHEECKKFLDTQEQGSKKKNRDFDDAPIEFEVGLKYLPESRLASVIDITRNTESKWMALEEMLACCGTDIQSRRQVMELFSALLAGIMARGMKIAGVGMPLQAAERYRAPIVWCHRKDGVEDTLADIVESVAVDNTKIDAESAQISYHQPAVITRKLDKVAIQDVAFIRLCGVEKKEYFKRTFPAQYRDTSIMLCGQHFSRRDTFSFQKRNPWASILLYATPDANILVDPIRLDANVFAQSVYCDRWDKQKVQRLIFEYAYKIQKCLKSKREIKNLESKLKNYDLNIAKHNHIRGACKIRGLQHDWLLLQFLATDLLVDFIGRELSWADEVISAQTAAWHNLLLPGCCSMPDIPEAQKIREQMLSPEDDCVNACQEALKTMICQENFHLITYVPKIKDYSKIDGNALGYLRMYRQNRIKQEYLTLQIREDKFCQYAKQYRNANWKVVLAALRKKAPSWLLDAKMVRMPWLKTDSEKALVIKVEELNSFSKDMQDLLFNCILLN